ncbi:hypothetical protein P5V15_008244 [Pogonomyrmex californicus]
MVTASLRVTRAYSNSDAKCSQSYVNISSLLRDTQYNKWKISAALGQSCGPTFSTVFQKKEVEVQEKSTPRETKLADPDCRRAIRTIRKRFATRHIQKTSCPLEV